MKNAFLKHCVFLLLLALPCAAELPIGSGPDNLKGVVIDWVWRSKITYSQEGDSTQTYQREIPDHYLLILKIPHEKVETLKWISSVVRLTDIRHPIMDTKLAADEVLLILESGRVQEMKIDQTIEIEEYKLFHALGWTQATYKNFTINEKQATAAGNLFENRATTDALEERVRAALPKGWQVAYDKNDTFLEITRTEEALAFSAFPNQSEDQKPKMTSFALSFRVIPPVTQEEYNRLTEENKKTNQEIEALYKNLESRGLSQKFESFLAEKEEDKKLVDQYNKLRKSLHDLPDFHFRDISLNWLYGSADYPLVYMKDENIQKECEEVRDKVVKLFDQYESVSP